MSRGQLMTAANLCREAVQMLKNSVSYVVVCECSLFFVSAAGWATVYTGLEKAAKALATSLTKETVTVVSHK